MIAEKGEGLNK